MPRLFLISRRHEQLQELQSHLYPASSLASRSKRVTLVNEEVPHAMMAYEASHFWNLGIAKIL